jgi:lipopolysaccharide biosynthesis glycosyltransferase
MFGDQDYFSLVLAADATILPPQYNFLTHFQMFKTRDDALRATGIPASAWYTEEQYAAAQKNPVIHHFLGHTLGRPWYKESLNPLRSLYCKIAAEAGFPEVTEQSRPIELEHKILYLTWKSLPHALFSYACRAMYSYFFRTRYGV